MDGEKDPGTWKYLSYDFIYRKIENRRHLSVVPESRTAIASGRGQFTDKEDVQRNHYKVLEIFSASTWVVVMCISAYVSLS